MLSWAALSTAAAAAAAAAAFFYAFLQRLFIWSVHPEKRQALQRTRSLGKNFAAPAGPWQKR